MEMLKNKQTGKSHTAKWSSILSAVGGIIVLLCAGAGKYTGLTWETAIPFAMLLFGVSGVGFGTMAKRNRGQNGMGESKNQ
jgi:TM2 domain-containing membrane protein YozV